MSEILYVAAVSPVYKITFSEEFNSRLTIISSVSPWGYTACLKKSKSKVTAKFLPNVFLPLYECAYILLLLFKYQLRPIIILKYLWILKHATLPILLPTKMRSHLISWS